MGETIIPKIVMEKEAKACRCVLCGEMIVAESEADCVAHMDKCKAFNSVHPESGGTNFDGIYTGRSTSSPASARTKSPSTQLPEAVGEQLNADDGSAGTTAISKSDFTNIDEMSIKELKRLISSAGLSFADCIEKGDLRTRAREALTK